jgi:CubicO group peptidase (beta-lactamase class C family)
VKVKFSAYLFVTILSFFSAFPIFADSALIKSQSENENKIHSIENGLKQQIQIKGQNSQGMNIFERMKVLNVPGISIAVIHNGEIAWAKSYNTSAENPVTTQTLFQAGSISKPVSAAVALSLVEKNKLNLDQDVNDILKTWKIPDNEYTKKEKVTLRRLLSHTAGLNVPGFQGYSSLTTAQALPSIIQTLNGSPPANNLPIEPDNTPGKKYSYSGGGYVVMQEILEEITQEKFSDLARERIFNPLQMKSSTYKLMWPKKASANASVGHTDNGKVVLGNWHLLPESTAAGLWSTPSDLAHFIIEIQNNFNGKSNKLLSTGMVKKMLTKQPNSEMGLGFALNPISQNVIEFSHNGVNVGYVAYFVGFTDIGEGAVIMTNSSNGGRIIPEIIRSIADTYHWPEGYTNQHKTVQPITLDPVIYQKYRGQYEINGPKPLDPRIKLALTVENNKFFITLPFPSLFSENKTFELIPESDVKFFTVDGDFEIEFMIENNNEFSIMGAKAYKVSSNKK